MKLWRFPNAIYLCGVGALCALLLGQFHIISTQNKEIRELLGQNTHLRTSLADTEEKIDTLFAAQTEIRTFQQELDSWVKLAKLGPFKKYGHLVESRNKNSVPVFSLVEKEEGPPVIRLAKLEKAYERAKFDLSSLLGEALRIKEFLFKVPSLSPARGHISSNFGNRIHPISKTLKKHNGVDIAGRLNEPVYATAAGVVDKAEYSPSYGNMIEIRHEHGFRSRYAHLNSRMVKKGDRVGRGQQIGKIGNSGHHCRGTHLHYEIMQGKSQLDPAPFMVMAPPLREDHLL